MDTALLDNLHPGAEVISADGKKAGKLYAVVVDERDEEVTHIVLNTGPFFPAPGFGAPNLVSVPVEEMADAQEGKVILRCTKKKLSAMPSYADWTFAWQSNRARPSSISAEAPVWRPAAAAQVAMGSWAIAAPTETTHKARFEREIVQGAHVWRVTPHIHIGDVDRILTDEHTDEVEALVVRRGLLFGHDVILPIRFVMEILDDIIHVEISDEELERLEPFKPEV
ncbi:MAG TPA: PRC-barrel domain-containing protein [Gemmataceae bacterium]|nr:PRC-barrel domain-containing protein [Gemmataceae bacterium]